MRIIIVGYMASGKTAVGRLLSNKLNLNFVDIDDEIEKVELKKISEIFEKNGEEYFRNLETQILKKTLKKDYIVISTGGGVIIKDKNIDLLKEEENVFFLDASVDTILKRVKNETNKRPLLKKSKNLGEKINTMLEKRYNKYIKVSSKVIDVNCKNIEEVVDQILVYIR